MQVRVKEVSNLQFKPIRQAIEEYIGCRWDGSNRPPASPQLFWVIWDRQRWLCLYHRNFRNHPLAILSVGGPPGDTYVENTFFSIDTTNALACKVDNCCLVAMGPPIP